MTRCLCDRPAQTTAGPGANNVLFETATRFLRGNRKHVAKVAKSNLRSLGMCAYARSAEAMLIEKSRKLEYVKAKIEQEIESGRIDISEQLQNAERQADSHLVTAQEKLAELNNASADSWEDLRKVVDTALDDLSQSTKKIVARLS